MRALTSRSSFVYQAKHCEAEKLVQYRNQAEQAF